MRNKHTDKEQSRRFQSLMANWPEPGTILEPLNGISAEVEWNPQRQSLWTTAIIDPDATGWFLDLQTIGVKCMFVDHCFEEIWDRVQKAQEQGKKATVGSLRVLRLSNRQTCLICELVEDEE